MPISKDGNNVVQETAPADLKQFERTGVIKGPDFAVCDKVDLLKQIKFDPSGLSAGETVTVKTSGTSIGFGSGANFSEFESDGTLKFNGDAGVWDDISIAILSTQVGANPPDIVDFVNSNLKVRAFDGVATTEKVYGTAEMRHGYKSGTDIELHVHWTPTTADAGNVVWQVYYSIQNPDGTFDTPTLLTASAAAAGGTAWAHKYTTLGTITGTNLTFRSTIVFQIFRDPTHVGDTYEHDAALINFGIHYQADTVGSREQHTK